MKIWDGGTAGRLQTAGRGNGRAERRSGRSLLLAVLALALPLVLAACGDDDNDEPTPVPTAAAQATSVGGGGTTSVATPAAGAVTVGQIADRIIAAWPTSSYRRVEVSGPLEAIAAAATPAAGSNSLTIVDEVLLPDQVHRTMTGEGRTVAEFIVSGGRFYARGEYVIALFDPNADPLTWVELDVNSLTPNTPAANMYAQISSLLAPRFSQLSADERNREAVSLGTVDVDGRACDAYQTVETTATGERRDIIVNLTADGQLCAVASQGGGVATIETYTFGAPVTITAPDGATSAAAGASPAVAATPEA